MTSSNARDYIPLLEALADGELQFNQGSSTNPVWQDCFDPGFDSPPEHYRRKPRPTLVPLDASDFASRPVTWVVDENMKWMTPIDGISLTQVSIRGVTFSFADLRSSGFLWCDRPSMNAADWKKCEKALPCS